MPLGGAVKASGNTGTGCDPYYLEPRGVVNSPPLAPTQGLAVMPPCQCLVRVPFPDTEKQVHLWSSNVDEIAGCYFSVPGRAWPCPALALGVVAAM